MSQNLSTEAYGPRVEFFFHDYNIKVENYDAVMGREPLRGGPSSASRQKYKYSQASKGDTRTDQRYGGFLDAAGQVAIRRQNRAWTSWMKGAAGGAIAMLAIAVLGGLIRKKFDQPVIEAAMKKIAGEIDVKLAQLMTQSLAFWLIARRPLPT